MQLPAMVTTIIVMGMSFPRASFTSDETRGAEGSEEGGSKPGDRKLVSLYLIRVWGFGAVPFNLTTWTHALKEKLHGKNCEINICMGVEPHWPIV